MRLWGKALLQKDKEKIIQYINMYNELKKVDSEFKNKG